MKNTNERNSSFELLKVLALLLIIFSSALPYGATYNGGYLSFVNLSVTNPSWTHIFYTMCRWGGQIGDTIFISCSAWFLCKSKSFKMEKIIKLVLASWILSLIGLLIASCVMEPSTSEILKSILPISFKTNWFVGCYLIYYLIHCYINRALEGISEKEFKIICLVLFLAYSVSTCFGSYYYFSALMAFVMIHVLVKYMKEYGFQNLSLRKCWTISCVSAALLIAFIIITNKLGIMNYRNLYFCHYYNPIVIFICLPLLKIAENFHLKNSFIDTWSSLSLYIYLTHANYFWLTYGKYKVYDIFSDAGISSLSSTLILIGAYIFLSFVLAYITKTVVDFITNRLIMCFELCNKPR